MNTVFRLLLLILATCSWSEILAQDIAPADRLKISGENKTFEWFFLLTDAGNEHGIWRKNGLDPEFVPAAGSAVQLKEQVASGIRIGWVNTAEALLARLEGVPVKIVAAHFGYTIAKIFTKPDAAISLPGDLNGKKIGVISELHTSYKAVHYLNQKLGIRAEPVPLGNLASNVAALNEGKIDALYSAEGAALGLVDAGKLKVAVRLADVYPRPYATVVVWATEDLIRENPSVVGRFVTATLETIRYLQSEPASASALYVKRTGATKPVADKSVAELNALLTSAGRGSGNSLTAAVGGNWEFTTDSGSVPSGRTLIVKDAVDDRFVPRQ